MTCGTARLELNCFLNTAKTTYNTTANCYPRISSRDSDRTETQQRKVSLELLDMARGIDEPGIWLFKRGIWLLKGRGGALSLKDGFPLRMLLA
jgi:hypothetical protein